MRPQNLHIYAASLERAKELEEDYKRLGYDVDRDGQHVIVLALRRQKIKKKDEKNSRPASGGNQSSKRERGK